MILSRYLSYRLFILFQYSQNPQLREILFATGDTILAEASPDDTRWGIGYKKDNPLAWNVSTWRGENWLGYIITDVRNKLRQLVCK